MGSLHWRTLCHHGGFGSVRQSVVRGVRCAEERVWPLRFSHPPSMKLDWVKIADGEVPSTHWTCHVGPVSGLTPQVVWPSSLKLWSQAWKGFFDVLVSRP